MIQNNEVSVHSVIEVHNIRYFSGDEYNYISSDEAPFSPSRSDIEDDLSGASGEECEQNEENSEGTKFYRVKLFNIMYALVKI